MGIPNNVTIVYSLGKQRRGVRALRGRGGDWLGDAAFLPQEGARHTECGLSFA